jgi:hypothetical protein
VPNAHSLFPIDLNLDLLNQSKEPT